MYKLLVVIDINKFDKVKNMLRVKTKQLFNFVNLCSEFVNEFLLNIKSLNIIFKHLFKVCVQCLLKYFSLICISILQIFFFS